MLHDVEVTRLDAIDHGAAEVTVTGQITCDMAGGSGLDATYQGALGPSAAVLAPVLSQASAAAPSAAVLAPRPLPALRRRPIPAVVAPRDRRRCRASGNPSRSRPSSAIGRVPGRPRASHPPPASSSRAGLRPRRRLAQLAGCRGSHAGCRLQSSVIMKSLIRLDMCEPCI